MTEDPIPFRPRKPNYQLPMAKKLQMLAREKQHAELLADCTPAQLELARTFQRLAFAGADNQMRWEDLGLSRPDFEPAPMYVRQALACDSEPDLHLQLIINLQKG